MIGIATSLALASGFFSLGAVYALFLKYRTRFLWWILLFLVSLILILGGTLIHLLEEHVLGGILSLAGVVLNIYTVPYMVSALISVPILGSWKTFLRFWNATICTIVLLYPFLPEVELMKILIYLQLVFTIIGALVVTAFHLNKIPRLDIRFSIVISLWITAGFLILFVIDILITDIPIPLLSFFDGLSLPIYSLALNVGLFVFAERFLDEEPLMRGEKITESCRSRYGLTQREGEIVELLLAGSSTQEVADRLYLSPKTVENHIYNLYRKTGVKNRIQLVGLFYPRSREEEEE